MVKSYCQSCGMELEKEIYGTNLDNSTNKEYCIYCFKNGMFLNDCTMDDMINERMKKMKKAGMLKKYNRTETEAHEFMKSFFPNLKRWKDNNK